MPFRDPVSVAVGASLIEFHESMRALRDAIIDQVAQMVSVSELDCPNHLP